MPILGGKKKEAGKSPEISPSEMDKTIKQTKLSSEQASGFTEAQLQLLKKDFGNYSEAMFKVYRASRGEPKFTKKSHVLLHWDMQTGHSQLLPEGIAWWGDYTGFDYITDKPQTVGTPMDYINIHGDYEKIKDFVKQKISAGIDERQEGHDSVDVVPAEYVIWFFAACQSQEFKAMLVVSPLISFKNFIS